MLFLFQINLDLDNAVVAAAAAAQEPVPTSGTINQQRITTGDLIDHAFRRCTIQPSTVTGENLDTAVRLLHMNLSRLASLGIPMWAIEREVIGFQPGVSTQLFPFGTVEVLNLNLRQTSRITGTPSIAALNDDDLLVPYNFGFAGGTYTLTFDSVADVSTVGIMPGVTATWDATIEYTTDGGATWLPAWENEALSVVRGNWLWLDIEGAIQATAIRLVVAPGSSFVVNEVYFGNNGREVPLSLMNRDDYSSLPNKAATGRPVQYWLDKQRSTPAAHLWPTPSAAMKYYQLTTYVQRAIQDVGDLSQIVEIPRRWYLAVINGLAKELAMEVPGVPPDVKADLKIEAKETLSEAWAGETDSAPVRLRYNLRPYQ